MILKGGEREHAMWKIVKKARLYSQNRIFRPPQPLAKRLGTKSGYWAFLTAFPWEKGKKLEKTRKQGCRDVAISNGRAEALVRSHGVARRNYHPWALNKRRKKKIDVVASKDLDEIDERARWSAGLEFRATIVIMTIVRRRNEQEKKVWLYFSKNNQHRYAIRSVDCKNFFINKKYFYAIAEVNDLHNVINSHVRNYWKDVKEKTFFIKKVTSKHVN